MKKTLTTTYCYEASSKSVLELHTNSLDFGPYKDYLDSSRQLP